MKALRFLGYLGLFTIVSAVTIVTVVVRNQTRIAEVALDRIHQRTGFQIRIAGTRIGFGTRLAVVLERPRVLHDGVEVATLQDIRAVLSYRAIILHAGLPLARLVLDYPRARVPLPRTNVTIGDLLRLDAQAVTTLNWALDALSDTASQVDVIDAALTDQDDVSLLEHLDLRAHRRHRRTGNWPWLVDFDATVGRAPIHGLQLSGSLVLGPQAAQPDMVATGQLWFWQLDLQNLGLGAFKTSARLAGEMQAAFDKAGVLSGKTAVTINDLRLQGGAPAQNLKLGNYTASTSLRIAPDRFELSALTVRQGAQTILAGKAAMGRPFDDTRTLEFDLGGTTFELARSAAWMRAMGFVPAQLVRLAEQLNAGELTLTRAALETSQPLREWSAATLSNQLLVDAAVRNGGYAFPAESKLPPLTGLDAQLAYSAGVLKLSQGSSTIGGSDVTSLNAEANLLGAPGRISYKFKLKAKLDLASLYPGVQPVVRAASPAVADQLVKLDGQAPVTLDAAGDLNNLQWQTPRSYRASFGLGQIGVTLNALPAPIALRDGNLLLTPDLITIDHARLLPGGADGGYLTLNGTIEPRTPAALVHNLTAELHQIAIERWLPLFVAPDSLAADGPVGGMLTANSDPRGGALPAVVGKLTLGTGHIQLGFLRSPIATRSATLTLDGKGLALDVPGGKLEGQPLDLNLAVPDLAHPLLRIDARVARLDFEVMRFIRLPWSPRTPPRFFATPATGHIEAREASFDKLPMSEVTTDFSRDQDTWHVDNFRARVFGGTLNLRIAGRTGSNNWINMVGKIANMDAGPLFLLSGETTQPTLTGKLFVESDLWANTDVDFFESLAGTVSLEARDGTLNRFTLLTRILSLIDLKSWLTAHLPDPRVVGLPFKKLTGDFKGTRGDFYTENLRLDGPVMNISSTGDIRFGDSQIDMEVGLFPFDTANWIVHQIPIVGANLAKGSSGLVAAYFHVHGPFRDPTVTPKPITSVAEFVKKMLGLPINIIAPDTIK